MHALRKHKIHDINPTLHVYIASNYLDSLQSMEGSRHLEDMIHLI